jgi:hypothetical protein
MISSKLKIIILLMHLALFGCATLDGAYFFDKRTHWARSLTTESERSSIMNEIRPLAESILSCNHLTKITLEDFNTHESDFKSNWTESWRFFGCNKATYFTVQYFKEGQEGNNRLNYRILNGASCTGSLQYIDGYKCVRADIYYRERPRLRERKEL